MITIFDMQITARTLAQEARGEPIDGQQAVAFVIKNRLADGRWGKSLSSVCLWHLQFSGWRSVDPNFSYACSLSDDDPTLSHMMSVIQAALNTETDPTGGALFYFSDSMSAPPPWALTMKKCGHFGSQSFWTDKIAGRYHE